MNSKQRLIALTAVLGLVATLWALTFWPAAAAQPRETGTHTLTLAPIQDNTLYESEAGTISNGRGEYLFAGANQRGELRRAVVAFDLSAIPPSATVLSATLTLTMSKSIAGETPVTLHTLEQAWGEGASDALGEEGGGAAAEPGDATWLFAFYDTTPWAMPGGDFDAGPVATTPVDGKGAYEWTSAAMAADVQRWVNDRDVNFGWLILGDESTAETAKRFDSRENDTANRPSLTVVYSAEEYAAFAPVVIR